MSNQASHCFQFEQDFIGNWRCIPLCVRRKLDLMGLKLKLNHWIALSQAQRQELVEWPDDRSALERMRQHLKAGTALMADGMASDLPPATQESWQLTNQLPAPVEQAALQRGLTLSLDQWGAITELERFALCKLVRPGHDHHNLEAAFSEVFG